MEPYSAWYRTHPEFTQRRMVLHERAQAQGWPRGGLTPLPAQVHAWLKVCQAED